jgi:hypothetical protein
VQATVTGRCPPSQNTEVLGCFAGERAAVSIRRIDATWAAFFGLSPPTFLRPGIQVVGHHQLADYQGVWLFRHHASLCLSVPPDSVEGV